jgi:hypothetical protein
VHCNITICKDQALLFWWNTLLVLDLGLDVVDGVDKNNAIRFPF